MINFLKYSWGYALLSAIVIGIGLFSIVRYGMSFSIDFTGGTILDYKLSRQIKTPLVRQELEKENIKAIVVQTDSKRQLHIRALPIDEKKEVQLRGVLEKNHNGKIQLLRFETVGPTLGKENIRKTVTASVVAIIVILLYMTYAFKRLNYGIAAVGAMIHDFLVLIGVYSLVSHFFGAQVDTLFVTAVLTTLSFSVHDTIIVFDKIREYQKTNATFSSIPHMANQALTETMVRSVNNSLTIMLMLVPLILYGGETIRFFAVALFIGTVTGVYSSPFIATPLLVYLEQKKQKK